MVAQFVADLHLPISQIRLESYRPPNGTDLEMVTNYFWDMELARALMPSIHGVELSLRNSIHGALANHYQTDMWFYQPGVLEPGQLSQLASALGELSRKKAKPTAGRIVAEVTFGFWVALLTSPYDQRIWQPNGFALLATVFPYATGLSRKQIQQHYNKIRELRNRVSHHEAIWDRPNLSQEHANIQRAIGWISPKLQQVLNEFDCFTDVYQHGRASAEQTINDYLGIA